MSAHGLKSLPAIGFLTVCSHADHGLFGGYLILNSAGRPLEFHCTAPVRPTRAQEILYGPTLEPYLYGEQIGQTLLTKAKLQPLFVCTDTQPALDVRAVVTLPVALVLAEQEQATADSLVTARSHLVPFRLGTQMLAVLRRYPQDQTTIAQAWETHAPDLDLWEPFGRIRTAIEEAQRGARAA